MGWSPFASLTTGDTLLMSKKTSDVAVHQTASSERRTTACSVGAAAPPRACLQSTGDADRGAALRTTCTVLCVTIYLSTVLFDVLIMLFAGLRLDLNAAAAYSSLKANRNVAATFASRIPALGLSDNHEHCLSFPPCLSFRLYVWFTLALSPSTTIADTFAASIFSNCGFLSYNFSCSMSDRSDAESDTKMQARAQAPPAPAHRVTTALRSALDLVVQSKGETGDFATFDSVELPFPGLTILPAPTDAASGGGQPIHVSLPLTTTQASEIKARASRAPFGRGDKTLYDTAVRDTWQVNPDQISILNSAFHAAVRLVLVIVRGG
jgi:hypothetical protein